MASYRVVLVQPPVEDFYDTDIRLQPIGLAYLKAALLAQVPDVEVTILDFHCGWSKHTVKLPSELRYLKEYYKVLDESPFRSFYHYNRFGARNGDMVAKILELSPDLIGISSLFSPYYREVQSLVRDLKGADSTVPIVLGGSHVSACPEMMLSQEEVDFIITGEGELPLVSLVSALIAKKSYQDIPQLGYKTNEGMVINKGTTNLDLDLFPIPDISDLSPKTYSYKGQPACFIITSRSCPHRCTFCSVHTTFGTSYRRRTTESVLSEIRQRVSEGYRVIDFEDDNLSFYQTEFREILQGIISEFGERNLTLLAMNGISYISLNPDLLTLMNRAGFSQINLALVSSDKSVREASKRPHTRQKFIDIVHAAFASGIDTVAYQILGLPGESLESMIHTLGFLASLPVQIGVSTFYLTPSSPIAKNFGPRLPEDIFKARSTAIAICEEATREDLYTLFVSARILNFIKQLPLPDSCDLQAVSSIQTSDRRVQMGVEQLTRILNQGELWLLQRNGAAVLQPKFQAATFRKVLDACGFICTAQGHQIRAATQ